MYKPNQVKVLCIETFSWNVLTFEGCVQLLYISHDYMHYKITGWEIQSGRCQVYLLLVLHLYRPRSLAKQGDNLVVAVDRLWTDRWFSCTRYTCHLPDWNISVGAARSNWHCQNYSAVTIFFFFCIWYLTLIAKWHILQYCFHILSFS